MTLDSDSSTRRAFSRRDGVLRALRRLLLRCHRLAMRRSGWTLLATLAAVLALGGQTPRLRVLLSLGSLNERGLRATASDHDLRARFHTGNELILLFSRERAGDALEPRHIAQVRAWLEREERENPEVTSVVSPFSLRRTQSAGPYAIRTPFLDSGSREEMTSLAGSPWGGILTDQAGRDLAAQLELRDAPRGSRYGRFDPRVVGAIERWLQRDFPRASGVRVHLAGPAAFEYFSLRGIQWFRWLNVAMVILIVVLLRALLGTWRSGALLVGVLVIASLGVAGGMALTGAPVDLLSTGMFLILAVAALEDFVFLSCVQMNDGLGWRGSFRQMLVPGLLTSLTTVIGFWSLCTSDMAVVARLGLWAGVGAALEWTVTFLVLPAFLARFSAWRTWVDPRRAWWRGVASSIGAGSLPHRRAVALLLVYGFGVYGALHLNHNDSIPRLFDARHPFHRSFDYLERTRGYQGFVHLVLPQADARARNEAAFARVATLPGVTRVLSPYAVFDAALGTSDVLPSELEELNPGAMLRLRGFFAPDGHVRGIVYLRRIDSDSLRRTLRAIDATCAPLGGTTAGDLVTYSEFSDRVPATLYSSLGTCLLLVAVLLWALLWLRRVRGKVVVLAASFWGVATMMAALWLLRVPLSFLTCGFASVLVGLTGDNVIQYLFASPHGRLGIGLRDRGGASIQVALLMALASLLFVGSAFVPSRRLGVLLAAGFVLTLAGDLWVLKALWRDRAPAPAQPAVRGRTAAEVTR